jgi:hypothetical protein
MPYGRAFPRIKAEEAQAQIKKARPGEPGRAFCIQKTKA